MQALLRPGDVALDIGANNGAMYIRALSRAALLLHSGSRSRRRAAQCAGTRAVGTRPQRASSSVTARGATDNSEQWQRASFRRKTPTTCVNGGEVGRWVGWGGLVSGRQGWLREAKCRETKLREAGAGDLARAFPARL
jgi:hypothetical protein